MYGLGFATAQERGLQMTYGLRVMQGRLAEILGDRPRGGRKETALDNDRRMRTFGWTRAASRIAAKLDPGTRGLLEAYCEGVNASFAAQQTTDTLHPLFQQFDVAPEKWTPADCLLSWWHVAQYFAGDGTRDLMVWRNRTQPPPSAPAMPMPSASWVDDAAAVVQREDVSQEWLREVERFCATSGLSGHGSNGAPNDPPKFSHAWVVGGKRTTTGSAVLVSDPQTPVRNPSLWMEFHVKGKTFGARGVGMPGSPGLLIGFNRRVAWGLTALGADQADLFRLETSAEHPDQYRWNGQWRPMEVHTETILVKGGAPTTLTIRDTHLGPVVSEFAFRQPGDPEVALKRVPVCETDRDTIQGVFAIMRALDAKAFQQALADWRFPSANCVYGDAVGHIGYSVVGAIRVGPLLRRSRGGEGLPGTGDGDDWRGFVPAALVPQVQDPRLGFLLSANHRPIASFYPVGLGTSTGSMGDTIRSWRLRERLSGRERFSPADVREVHYDTVNPARREIVRLGLHLRATQPEVLSEASLKALAALEEWLAAGASSDLRSEHADLATRLSTFFRFVVTPLARRWAGRVRAGAVLGPSRIHGSGSSMRTNADSSTGCFPKPGARRALRKERSACPSNPESAHRNPVGVVRQSRRFVARSRPGCCAPRHHVSGRADDPLPISPVLHAMGSAARRGLGRNGVPDWAQRPADSRHRRSTMEPGPRRNCTQRRSAARPWNGLPSRARNALARIGAIFRIRPNRRACQAR